MKKQTSPSEFLRSLMKEQGLTAAKVASDIGASLSLVNKIIGGSAKVTPRTAALLDAYFDQESGTWLKLQYDADQREFADDDTFQATLKNLKKVKKLPASDGKNAARSKEDTDEDAEEDAAPAVKAKRGRAAKTAAGGKGTDAGAKSAAAGKGSAAKKKTPARAAYDDEEEAEEDAPPATKAKRGGAAKTAAGAKSAAAGKSSAAKKKTPAAAKSKDAGGEEKFVVLGRGKKLLKIKPVASDDDDDEAVVEEAVAVRKPRKKFSAEATAALDDFLKQGAPSHRGRKRAVVQEEVAEDEQEEAEEAAKPVSAVRTKADEPVEAPVVRRGRGRPRKTDAPAAPAAKKREAAIDVEAGADASDAASAVAEPAAAPKRRGRPPKVKPAEQTAPAAPAAKQREDALDSEADGGASDAAPIAAEPAAPKRRGRPPKAKPAEPTPAASAKLSEDAADAANTDASAESGGSSAEPVIVRRPRGRPRKDAGSAAAPAKRTPTAHGGASKGGDAKEDASDDDASWLDDEAAPVETSSSRAPIPRAPAQDADAADDDDSALRGGWSRGGSLEPADYYRSNTVFDDDPRDNAVPLTAASGFTNDASAAAAKEAESNEASESTTASIFDREDESHTSVSPIRRRGRPVGSGGSPRRPAAAGGAPSGRRGPGRPRKNQFVPAEPAPPPEPVKPRVILIKKNDGREIDSNDPSSGAPPPLEASAAVQETSSALETSSMQEPVHPSDAASSQEIADPQETAHPSDAFSSQEWNDGGTEDESDDDSASEEELF